jgi:hypothetical protein
VGDRARDGRKNQQILRVGLFFTTLLLELNGYRQNSGFIGGGRYDSNGTMSARYSMDFLA